MNNIFALEAFKFSFKAFLKNIKFLFVSLLVSGAIFFAGIVTSVLASAVFLIPIYVVLDNIKETFVKLLMTSSFEVAMKTGLTPDLQATLAQTAQSWEVWSKFFVEIFYNYPFAILFAILGFFVFLTLIFVLLIMLATGWIKISLNIVDGRENKLSVLFPSLRMIFKVFNFSTLLLLILIAPWVATIFIFGFNVVAGAITGFFSVLLTVYLSIKVAYGSWFLIDKDAGVMEAIKFSFGLKWGSRNLLLLFLLFIPIHIAIALLQRFTIAIFSLVFLKYIVVLVSLVLQYAYSTIVIISIGYLYRALGKRSK